MWFGTRHYPRSDRGRRRRRQSVHPILEELEDRLTPSGVAVGTTVAEATLNAAQTAAVTQAATNLVTQAAATQTAVVSQATAEQTAVVSQATATQSAMVTQATATQSAAVNALNQQAAAVTALSQAQSSLLTNAALTTLSNQQSASVNALSQVQSSLLSNAASANNQTQQAASNSYSQSQSSLVTNAGGAVALKGTSDPTVSTLSTARSLSQQVLSLIPSTAARMASSGAPPSDPSAGGDPEGNGDGSTSLASASAHSSAVSDSTSLGSPSADTVTLTFTPDRLIYVAGSSSVSVAVAVVNSATGSAVNGGSVTFSITDAHGVSVGSGVVSVVSAGGQASATYPLPANLTAGAYTMHAAYSNGDGSLSGSGSEVLSLVLPPAPVQHLASGGLSSALAGPDSSASGDPTQPSPSLFQAALTLYLDGAEMIVNQLTGHPSAAVQASIDYDSPYVRLYSPLLVLAGELAAYQAIRPPQ